MLPFPIISNTNIIIDRFKLYSSSSAFFLHDIITGNLYVTSTGTQSSGTGKAETKFALSATNVKRVWLEDNSSNMQIYEDNDGKFWCTGKSNAITASSSATFYNTWTDITSLFSTAGLSGSNIEYMSSFYDLKLNVISSTGNLYCSGKNNSTTFPSTSFGDGTNTDSPNALKLITSISNIKKAVGNYYLRNDGNLYVTGNNLKYQLGNGTTTSISTLQFRASNVKDVNAGYQNLYYITNDGNFYGAGTQFGVQYGNEFGTGYNGSAFVYTTPTLITTSVHKLYVSVGNMATHIVKGDVLYSSGNNQLAQFGVGDITPRHTHTISAEFTDSTQFARSNIGSLLLNNNKLYYSGRNDVVMGGINSQYTYRFTEVPLSF